MAIQAAEISAILKDQIKNFGQEAEVAERVAAERLVPRDDGPVLVEEAFGENLVGRTDDVDETPEVGDEALTDLVSWVVALLEDDHVPAFTCEIGGCDALALAEALNGAMGASRANWRPNCWRT